MLPASHALSLPTEPRQQLLAVSLLSRLRALRSVRWRGPSRASGFRRSPRYSDGRGWDRRPHRGLTPRYYDTTVSILMKLMAWVWGRAGTILSGSVCLWVRSARRPPLSGATSLYPFNPHLYKRQQLREQPCFFPAYKVVKREPAPKEGVASSEPARRLIG